MTIDELIEQLKALPKDVRKHPLVDGRPAVGYRLAPLDHISVEKVLAADDGFCSMTDPELTDAENVAEAGDRYGMSTRIERRALAFFDCGETDMDSTLKEYFERVRQAYGIELVGTIESGDMRNETDGKEDHGRQSRDGEAPGWSLVPADICIGTGEFLTNGDVGIISDPDEEPGEWVERKTIRQQERMEEDR